MKILFYADTVFGFGGVQRVLSVVARSLAAHHEVDILTIDSDDCGDIYGYHDSGITLRYLSYHTSHDLQYYCCKAMSMAYKRWFPHNAKTSSLYARSFFLPRYKRLLIDAVNAGNYDVVIGVHAFLSLHLASVRSHLNAKKVVGWMHNSYHALFEKESPYLPGLRQFFVDMMRRLDDMVVLTHADASLFMRNHHLPSKVIHNPLTLTPRGMGSAAHKRFLAVGRFSPRHKGFDLLLEAFALFAAHDSEWTLEIVGEGEEEDMLRRIIADRGIGGRVTISPFTADIQSHYASASVFVLSSRWEGQPLVLIEAMAHGLPVISSDIPVSRELIEGSGAGVLFESENIGSLCRTMADMTSSDRLAAMSAAALDYARHFSPAQTAAQWTQLLSIDR